MNQRFERGFTYPIAMFAVAVTSILSLHAIENALTDARREQEAALLETGAAIADAIRSYYQLSPGTVKTYPPSLDALLEDARTATLRRHLRKLYRDPVTGSTQWGLVMTEDGRVKGVYSLSTRSPLKKAGFPAYQDSFNNAHSYQDWRFVFLPTT